MTENYDSSYFLESALREYRHLTAKVLDLHSKSSRFLEKIQEKLEIQEGEVQMSFPIAELREVERVLNKSPAVIFIGNRNCGKSSLLNELLRGSYLPVDQTPCTSRIVRIRYSEKNTARVVGPDGHILEKHFKKKLPSDFVVLPDGEKDDRQQLEAVVEVGLNHELLKSGIELIDCPGKNEAPALDGVVDEFLEKGIAPLIVYLIDGNEHLRMTDNENILFLRTKLPHVSCIFVCNKIDIEKEAASYDDHDAAAATTQKLPKEEHVFSQLKEYGHIPQEAEIRSCEMFHGLSAKKVRDARLAKQSNETTENFAMFQKSFLKVLADSIRRHTRIAIDGITSVLDQFILAFKESVIDSPKAFKSLEQVISVALETEQRIADALKCKVSENLVDESLIAEALQKVKHDIVRDEHTVHKKLSVLPDEAFEEEIITGLFAKKRMDTQKLKDRTRFICDAAVTVGMKVAPVLQLAIRKTIEAVITGELTKNLQQVVQRIEVPAVKRALRRAYGMDLNATDGGTSCAAMIATPDEILRSIDDAIRAALAAGTYSVIRSQIVVERMHVVRSARQHAMDNAWKESVANSIMERFNPKEIAELVNQACKRKVSKMHLHFHGFMTSLLALFELRKSLEANSLFLKDLRLIYVPHLMQLAVTAYAVKSELEQGQVQLGDVIAKGKTAKIYSCPSSKWPADSAIRVVKEHEVGEELWIRFSQDVYHAKQCLEKQASPSPFLLRVHGWVMPEPGVLHVVTESVKTDLLAALAQGSTPESRLGIARDVASGLKSMHDAGYVFGDLKPQNILIAHDGTAKINLVKQMNLFQRTRLGYPFHLAIEVYKNEEGWRASNDIYAFGMLLWVLCDGTGSARPKAYEDYVTKSQMSKAVENNVVPERPQGSSDECYELMKICWENRLEMDIGSVIERLSAFLKL